MEQHITLYFKEGASDKVYQAHLQSQSDGWIVSFAYGRRGATLTTGRKTTQPVSLVDAQRIFDKLIREKTAKGYTEGESGSAYQDSESTDTGIRPQLLNPVSEEELPRLLADPHYLLQPKLDGRRLLIRKRGLTITGINRRGLECGIPTSIAAAVGALPGDFLLDGEAVGETYHPFDLLEMDEDLCSQPCQWRQIELLNLIYQRTQDALVWVPCYWGEREKQSVMEHLRAENAEGVVFKRIDAPYTPGRPASGGDQLKFKFVETTSVVIHKLNAKRSAAIAVHDGNHLVTAGNVTIPPDQPIPAVGQVAEVRYLYALPQSGALFQPVYLGTREDIEPGECLRSQLKFKAAA